MNPADSNDTIVAQITAMVAQFENRKRAELMMQSRLAKAKRGEVVSKLPAGWIKAADGKYAYDPAIRDTIRMIIDTFSQTRSIPRTVKALAEAGIRISYKTRRHRIGFRRIACERVRFILTHPAYAGTYIYGISHSQAGKPVLGNDESSRTNPEKRWISTYNHHPAYMSQQQQEEIKSILLNDFSKRSYRAHCCRALTKGLLRCALCGEILEVSYPSKAYVFRCRRLVEHAEKPCLNFSSNDLEQCILRQVFKVLKAPPIDMLKAALKASRIKKQTRISRIESERERLAHEERSAQERADLTRGSLPRVHFAALEKLENVLQEKEQFEQKIALERVTPSIDESEEELEELCRIASDVPGLWQHVAVTHQERKEILRCLIDHIVVGATKSRIDATIVWKSGGQTPVFVWRARSRHHLIRELYAQQLTAAEIKQHLAAGKTSTGQVVNITVVGIQVSLQKMGL
jgi:hypothetical protein